MRLHGTIDIAAPGRAVWELAIDPLTLASCIPGVRDIRRVDDRTFEGTITAAVGPMTGDFAFRSVIVQADYPESLLVEMAGEDSVTKSRVTTSVRAGIEAPAEDRSVLRYDAQVRVAGRLAIVGEMILRATASLVIGQVTACLRQRLEGAELHGAGQAG